MIPTNTLALMVAQAIKTRHQYVYSFTYAKQIIATLRVERAAGRSL